MAEFLVAAEYATEKAPVNVKSFEMKGIEAR